MIGTPDSEIISGYDLPKYEVDGKVTAELPKELGPIKAAAHIKIVQNTLDELQRLVADTIVRVKGDQRRSKASLETTKNGKMNTLGSETDRQKYLFNEYVPALRLIGMSKKTLASALDRAGLLPLLKSKTNQLIYNFKSAKLQWDGAGQTSVLKLDLFGSTKVTLLRLYLGAGGFEVAVAKGDGVQRAVYKKRLGPLSATTDFVRGPNEYVRDDAGVMTRRYAYGYKTLTAVEYLMGGDANVLRGRYAAAGHDVRSIDEPLRRAYAIPAETKTLTTREMLFVNQEKGSGDQQRGICLSSSPDKVIHGNKGETFAFDQKTNRPNILLKVDLAKVPEDGEQLFNLYSREAQDLTIGMAGTRSNGSHFDAGWAKDHTDTSTAKNREIFLLELKRDQIANADHVNSEIVRIKSLT